MGDLKPLGSEKLNGDDKLKRILELTYYNSTPKKSTNNNTKAEMIKESIGNGVYGIVMFHFVQHSPFVLLGNLVGHAVSQIQLHRLLRAYCEDLKNLLRQWLLK